MTLYLFWFCSNLFPNYRFLQLQWPSVELECKNESNNSLEEFLNKTKQRDSLQADVIAVITLHAVNSNWRQQCVHYRNVQSLSWPRGRQSFPFASSISAHKICSPYVLKILHAVCSTYCTPNKWFKSTKFAYVLPVDKYPLYVHIVTPQSFLYNNTYKCRLYMRYIHMCIHISMYGQKIIQNVLI